MVSVSETFFFLSNSLTFVAKCVRSGSPYALISGKFCFNILLQRKNITIYDTMVARGAISDRPCWASRPGHGLFFVILTNFHSILSEHKARDDNVNTRLLLWPVNKSHMSARLKCANILCSDRILTCRIKSICSPAKGGTGCYRFNYQPGS